MGRLLRSQRGSYSNMEVNSHYKKVRWISDVRVRRESMGQKGTLSPNLLDPPHLPAH